ncbi:hypothetical protein ACNOYE_16140 [Nannocystaceae bacterium ST9]
MKAMLLALALIWLGPPPEAPPEPPPASALPEPAPANEPDSPITVTTRLTPDPSHVGDLLTLEVIVAFPKDHSVNLPSGLDFSPLELVGVEEGEVESTGSDLRQRFTLELQYFDVGEASVPSFPITWIDPANEVHTHHVAPHAFVVESLLANEAEPQVRGEDPPVSLEYPDERLATILIACAGGILLGGALLALWLNLRGRAKPIVLPPPIPAHERALAELQRLEGERVALLAEGRAQDYYVRLTEIAKRYLEGRFGVDALERTTEEIREILLGAARTRIEPLDPVELLRFLEDCDLVKFARLSPAVDEAELALHTVRDMVERSRPAGEAGKPIVEPSDPDRAKATRPAEPRFPDPVGTGTAKEDRP